MPFSDVPSPNHRSAKIVLAFLGLSLVSFTGCNSPEKVGNTTNRSPITLPEGKAMSQAQAANASVLWSGSFRGDEQGDWLQNWQVQPQGRWGKENLEIIQSPQGQFSELLRVHYPAYSASPSVSRKSNVPLGGSQFYASLGISPQERLRFSYSVRFPVNFDFVKGGKLPGLYGGAGNSGGSIPNGSDGFSSRLMWRKNGAGEIYAYLPSSEGYGTSLGQENWHFKPGQWQRIEQELWLNQPGQTDGQVKVWVDGQLVLDQKDLIFRTVPELKIDGIFFSTFFGGGDRSWATPKDTEIDFANFEVSLPSRTN